MMKDRIISVAYCDSFSGNDLSYEMKEHLESLGANVKSINLASSKNYFEIDVSLNKESRNYLNNLNHWVSGLEIKNKIIL